MGSGERLSRPVGHSRPPPQEGAWPARSLGSPVSSRPRTGAIGFAKPSCPRSPTPAPWNAAAGRRSSFPPVPADSVARLIESLDGIVLTCGTDVNPALYDAAPHEKTDPPDRRRDRFELSLVRAAIDAQLPILAICRGMHILNVARGGTLIQHLPDAVGHNGHAPDPFRMSPATTFASTRAARSAPGSASMPRCRPCITRPCSRPARAW